MNNNNIMKNKDWRELSIIFTFGSEMATMKMNVKNGGKITDKEVLEKIADRFIKGIEGTKLD